jgi:hypothetical protein
MVEALLRQLRKTVKYLEFIQEHVKHDPELAWRMQEIDEEFLKHLEADPDLDPQ